MTSEDNYWGNTAGLLGHAVYVYKYNIMAQTVDRYIKISCIMMLPGFLSSLILWNKQNRALRILLLLDIRYIIPVADSGIHLIHIPTYYYNRV